MLPLLPLTLAEAVLEAAGQRLHVAKTPAARRLAADGLLAPLVCACASVERKRNREIVVPRSSEPTRRGCPATTASIASRFRQCCGTAARRPPPEQLRGPCTECAPAHAHRCAWWPRGSRTPSRSASGCGSCAARTAGTSCASCCGACLRRGKAPNAERRQRPSAAICHAKLAIATLGRAQAPLARARSHRTIPFPCPSCPSLLAGCRCGDRASRPKRRGRGGGRAREGKLPRRFRAWTALCMQHGLHGRIRFVYLVRRERALGRHIFACRRSTCRGAQDACAGRERWGSSAAGCRRPFSICVDEACDAGGAAARRRRGEDAGKAAAHLPGDEELQKGASSRRRDGTGRSQKRGAWQPRSRNWARPTPWAGRRMACIAWHRFAPVRAGLERRGVGAAGERGSGQQEAPALRGLLRAVWGLVRSGRPPPHLRRSASARTAATAAPRAAPGADSSSEPPQQAMAHGAPRRASLCGRCAGPQARRGGGEQAGVLLCVQLQQGFAGR